MIDVSRVINDPRVNQSLTIFRKQNGRWISGRFTTEEIEVNLSGTVGIASGKDIEHIPEGDRVGGELLIHTIKELFVTRSEKDSSGAGTSDELYWNGERYKIYSVFPYKDYGYYKAIAIRQSK